MRVSVGNRMTWLVRGFTIRRGGPSIRDGLPTSLEEDRTMTHPSMPRGDALDALLRAIVSEMRSRGLSSADVAKLAGVPEGTVQELPRRRPTMAAALALAWALDIAPSGTRPA